MKHCGLVALTALSRFASLGRAEGFSYVTAVVTECEADDEVYETDAATATRAVTTSPATHGSCSYDMPSCDCGCPTCSTTSVYTTAYPILCSTGVANQTYTITETYKGMSSLMAWPTPTTTPYGFTTSAATCTSCGDTPITTVITCPSGGSTYYDSSTNTDDATTKTYTTSTQYITKVHTITSCAPTVTNCPVGSVTTEVETTVTVCPVTSDTPAANATGYWTGNNTAGTTAVDDGASYAVSSAASLPTDAGDYGEGNTASHTAGTTAYDTDDEVDTATVTAALSAVPATKSAVTTSDNDAVQTTKLPVTVSGASMTSCFLTPIVLVVGFMAAQLA